MIYLMWQMDKTPISNNISNALQRFVEKFGQPPQVLETALPFNEVVLPDGLQLVIASSHLPKNIMLMGIETPEEILDDIHDP